VLFKGDGNRPGKHKDYGGADCGSEVGVNPGDADLGEQGSRSGEDGR